MTENPGITEIEAAQRDLQRWRKTAMIEADSDHEFVKRLERRNLSGMWYCAAMGLILAHRELRVLGEYANEILALSCIGIALMFVLSYRKVHRISVMFDRYVPQRLDEVLEKARTTEQIDGEGRR